MKNDINLNIKITQVKGQYLRFFNGSAKINYGLMNLTHVNRNNETITQVINLSINS